MQGIWHFPRPMAVVVGASRCFNLGGPTCRNDAEPELASQLLPSAAAVAARRVQAKAPHA